MENRKYCIVGAGLAGSTCAYLLKRAGCDVLLLEKGDLSRKNKLCAGLLTPRALKMLDSIFSSVPDALFQSNINSMRCVADTIPVDVHDIHMKSVFRAELDAFALNEYLKLGGEVLDRFHIRNFDFSNKRITARAPEGGLEEHDYDVLIAADGALSDTRKALTGSRPDAVLSLETQVDAIDSPLIMAYQAGFHGYSWYAPAGTKAKIGCVAYEAGADLDAQLRKFAAELGVSYQKRRGAFIPTGSDVLLEKDGVYFLGDAASLICPPSGEGIYFALASAYRLSLALLNSASYRALMHRDAVRIEREYRMRDLFFNKTFMTVGLKCADATPYGAERAVKFALRNFTSFE